MCFACTDSLTARPEIIAVLGIQGKLWICHTHSDMLTFFCHLLSTVQQRAKKASLHEVVSGTCSRCRLGAALLLLLCSIVACLWRSRHICT